MQFKLHIRMYSNGEEAVVVPETAPLPGAILNEQWVEEQRERRWYTQVIPHAVLDSQGNPVIEEKQTRVENTGTTYQFGTTVRQWLSAGRNQKTTKTHYIREMPYHYWSVEVSGLEDLVNLLSNTNHYAYFSVEDGSPVITLSI